jgi:hypothetical protein
MALLTRNPTILTKQLMLLINRLVAAAVSLVITPEAFFPTTNKRNLQPIQHSSRIHYLAIQPIKLNSHPN